MKNNQLQKFQKQYAKIQELIEKCEYEVAFNELSKLYQEFVPILGEKHLEMVCARISLAQVCIELDKIDYAQELFEFSIKQIRQQCDSNSQLRIDAQITYGRYMMSINNYKKAIEIFEKIIEDLGDVSKLTDSLSCIYYMIIDMLGSLYNQIDDHQKSIDMDIILIEKLLDSHGFQNEDVITQENMNFDETTRNQLISKYLGIGASLSRLGKFIEARKYLEKGYFISFTYYGDRDERTLKLNYNLAANEMQGIDYQEGLRQLRFVYKDMQKYLGDKNKYTLKAKEIIKELGSIVGKQ